MSLCVHKRKRYKFISLCSTLSLYLRPPLDKKMTMSFYRLEAIANSVNELHVSGIYAGTYDK